MSSKKNIVEEIPAIEGQKSTKRLVKVVVRKGLRTKIDRRRGRYKVKSKAQKKEKKKKQEEDEKNKLLNSPEYKLLLKKLQELQKQKTIEQRTERKIQPSGGYRATSKPYYSSFPKDGRTFTQDDTKLKKIEEELLKTQKILNDLTNKFKKDDISSPQQSLTKEQERTQKELKKEAKKQQEEAKKQQEEAKKQQEKQAKKSSGFSLFGRKKDVEKSEQPKTQLIPISSDEEQDSLKTFFTKRTPQPKFEDQFIAQYGNNRLSHNQAQSQQRTTDRQQFKDIKITDIPIPPTIPVDSPAFKALSIEDQNRLDPETAQLELPSLPDESNEEEDFTPSIGDLQTPSEKPQPTPEPEPSIITPLTEKQELLRNEIEQKQKEIDEFKVSKTASEAEPLKLTYTPLEAIPPPSKKVLSGTPLPVLSLKINTSRQPQLQAQKNLLITDRVEPVSTKELRKELKLSVPINLAQQEVEKTKSELEEQKAQSIADISELKERLIQEQKTADEKRANEISEELRRLEEKRVNEIQKELREFEQKEATKIQSAVRARQARTSFRTQQEGFNELQALVRGQEARKEFEKEKKRKENRELASKLVKGVVSNVFEKKRKEIEQKEATKRKEIEQKEATKIQSAVRGRQARTQLELERKKEQEQLDFERKKENDLQEFERMKKEEQQEIQKEITELEEKKMRIIDRALKYQTNIDGQRINKAEIKTLSKNFRLDTLRNNILNKNYIQKMPDVLRILLNLESTMIKISELNKELRKINKKIRKNK